jgi:tetratricopeptide (TPR) repeat protein
MIAATSVTTVPGYAFNGLGAVKYVQADYAAALESLRIAAALRAGDWEIVLNRGLVHLERGDIANSEIDLQSVLTACPADGRAQAAMARLQHRKAESQQRATEAAQDTSGGVNDAVAVLDAMQKALNAANKTHRLATGGLGGLLGKVRGSLNRSGTPPVSRGPFACDPAGRIGPAVSYQPLALPPPQTTEAPATPTTNPPLPAPANPPAADPFAGEQTAIVAVVAALTQALEARDVEKAGDCFEAAVRPQVKESLTRNQERLPQIAALLKEAKLTYVSAEAATPADGLSRTAELTVTREDRASYVQMVKLEGQWWVRSL